MSSQGQLFEIPSSWTPPSVLPNISGCAIALDLETRDGTFSTRGPGWAFKQYGTFDKYTPETCGYITGVGIATADAQWYFPVRHLAGGNLDPGLVKRWLADTLTKVKSVVCFNTLYDAGWLNADWGIDLFKQGIPVHDAMAMGTLIDEMRRRFSLNAMAFDELGKQKDETLLRRVAASYGIDPKSDMWQLHSKYVGPYGEQDPRLTYDLAKHFWPKMTGPTYDLRKVYEVETRIQELIIRMRLRGIPVDLERADRVRTFLKKKEKEALKFIAKETGFRVRQGVPTADAIEVFNAIGISTPLTKKGNPSVTAEWLESIAEAHPIATAVVEARRFQKAYRDFIDSGIFQKQVNGRIHCNYHPLKSEQGGTVTGRLSCSDPNLQQIPARDPVIGPLIRSCYAAELGLDFASLDYSSQEPRWTLHFAAELGLPGANEAVAVFKSDPTTDYHKMVQKIIGLESKFQAKTINLGLVYGMGPPKLCDQLGLPTEWFEKPDGTRIRIAGEEGQAILETYHEKLPYLRKLVNTVTSQGRRLGFVQTFLGRKCLVGGFEHKGLNRKIQGSAADQVKVAMLALDDAGYLPGLQVHDELDIPWCDGPKEAKKMAKIMEDCIPEMRVPSVVEPMTGPHWAAGKKGYVDIL